MQVVQGGRDAKIQMFRERRAQARARGDHTMVHNCDVELARLGPLETTEPDTPMERAVPPKPKRGRRPLPRCEHGKIVGRCLDCDDETIGAA